MCKKMITRFTKKLDVVARKAKTRITTGRKSLVSKYKDQLE